MGTQSQITITFGVALRQLREEAGMTQEQLGFESDLRRTFISVLELGQQQPSLTTIFKLAGALKILPSALVRRVEEAQIGGR
ncbi:MAG: helix-turn-helix domain-containing protein [Fluviibacter sp.]